MRTEKEIKEHLDGLEMFLDYLITKKVTTINPCTTIALKNKIKSLEWVLEEEQT